MPSFGTFTSVSLSERVVNNDGLAGMDYGAGRWGRRDDVPLPCGLRPDVLDRYEDPETRKLCHTGRRHRADHVREHDPRRRARHRPRSLAAVAYFGYRLDVARLIPGEVVAPGAVLSSRRSPGAPEPGEAYLGHLLLSLEVLP
jgi:hypothetical protein